MKSIFSYLLIIFTVLFWILRIAVAFTASMNYDIGIYPINLTVEIILLFVTLLAIVLVIRRNIIGAIIYFVSYFLYFGASTITQTIDFLNGSLSKNQYLGLFVSIIGILLAVLTLVDVLFNKNRTNTRVDRKTGWFYNNKDYDRQLDERADKNNYRTM